MPALTGQAHIQSDLRFVYNVGNCNYYIPTSEPVTGREKYELAVDHSSSTQLLRELLKGQRRAINKSRKLRDRVDTIMLPNTGAMRFKLGLRFPLRRDQTRILCAWSAALDAIFDKEKSDSQ